MKLMDVSELKTILDRGDGRKLQWDVYIFGKTGYAKNEDIYKEINGYWSSLTEDQKEKIWTIYEKIYFALKEIPDIINLSNRLSLLVQELFEFHNLDAVGHWVRFREHLKLPPDLKDMCGPEDDERTIQRTYLRKDYIELVVMAVALRALIPVWGELIRLIVKEVGSNFKEYEAMRIISKSMLISCPPMERLRRYIAATIDSDQELTSSILLGLGSSEIPDWLLSMVVIRRIAPGNIHYQEGRGSLISNIYAFLTGSIRDSDKKFGGMVKDKFPRDDKDDDDDRTSSIELYKVKQEASYAAIAIFSIYTEDPHKMLFHLDQTAPKEYLDECLASISDLYEMEIKTHHLTFSQWVINPVIPARAIHNLNKVALLRTMAVTQTLLWWWGFPDLALLSTATKEDEDKDNYLSVESRSRIPPDLIKQLNDMYPFKENIGRSKGLGVGNMAIRSIQMLVKELGGNGWVVHAPKPLTKSSNLVDPSGRMYLPANILEQLARLVVNCAN